jgi:hypothetical protein
MKKAIVLLVLAIALSACTSITPQQQQAQRVSTLNVYPDNRVGMKTANTWLWTEDSKKILAIEVRSQLYNVKDVSFIERVHKGKISVGLANGRTLDEIPDSFRWMGCNLAKECEDYAGIKASYNGKNLNFLLKRIIKNELTNPDTMKNERYNVLGDPRIAIFDDFRAIPELSEVGERIDTLNVTEFTILNERVATVLKAWDSKGSERAEAKKIVDAKRAEVMRIAEERYRVESKRRYDSFKNTAIGTTTYCERAFMYEFRKDKNLDCQNYGDKSYSVDDFQEAGWDVLSINTSPYTDSVGTQFTMYRVIFKKAR